MIVRANNSLDKIKADIQNYVGERVRLKANKGRKKTFVKEGILEQTYPNIFVIRFDGNQDSVRRASFSYSDILTQTVELTICRDNRKIKCG